MQKPRLFAAFQTKTSQLTPKLHNHKTRKAWYLRHFRQNATKKQEQKTWENENPETSSCSRIPRKTQGFPVFFLKYLPNINDAPRAAADARATLLLLLLLLLLFLLFLFLLLLVVVVVVVAAAAVVVVAVSGLGLGLVFVMVLVVVVLVLL